MNDVCNLSAEQQTRAPRRAPCQAELRAAAHDDRVRLGRHRRRRRIHPQAARRAAREPRRLVARRPARGRLRRAATRDKVDEARRCSRRLTAATPGRSAAAPNPARGRRVQRAVARRLRRELGSAGRLRRISTSPRRADAVWDAMLASDPSARPGDRACGARRTPRVWASARAAVEGECETPTLMVAGVHDKQVDPSASTRSTRTSRRNKVLLDLPARRTTGGANGLDQFFSHHILQQISQRRLAMHGLPGHHLRRLSKR